MIRQSVLRAIFTNWATKLVTLLIRFFLTPFILHRLGDVQFGLWALVASVVGQGALLDFGIRAALTKYVAEHYARENFEHIRRLIATSLWLYSGLGLLAVGFAAVLAPLFPHLFNIPAPQRTTAAVAVLLMGIQIGISIPAAAPAAVLWALHRYGAVNALVMASTVLSAAITAAILLSGGGLIAMMAAEIPLATAMFFVAMTVLVRAAPELRPRWRDVRRELLSSVLSFSASTFIIETAYSLQTKADELVIGFFRPVSAVAPYTIARRLSGIPQMVGEQIVGAFLPLASELGAEGGTDRLRSFYLVGSRVTLAVCIPLTVILTLMAGPLLTLWVGGAYSQYAPIVVVLVLAGLAEISHWPGGLILQGIARHRPLAIASTCAAIVNLVLSVLLVHPYGLIGVAVGTLIPSTVLSVCVVWPYLSHVLGVRWRDLSREIFLPTFFPVLPMIAVISGAGLIAKPSGFIATGTTASAGLLVYAAIYIIAGAGEPERQLLRSALLRLRMSMAGKNI